MGIHPQDTFDTFLTPSTPELCVRATRSTGEEIDGEDIPSFLPLLCETNKLLFDLALKNGFRILGAQ
jgi:hypothetical protein